VLILTQDSYMVGAKHSMASETILDALDRTPRDMGHVGSCFGLFGDSVSVSARYVNALRQTYHKVRNRYGRTRRHSKVVRLEWKLISVCFRIVLILTQDRCTVCAECIIGSKIILDAPDASPR
jgi:hypothetical protein